MSAVVATAEVEGVERTFDAIPSENPKRALWTMSPLLADTLDKPLRSYAWAYVQMDQGSEGACTGFSATMEAAARPVPIFGDPKRSAAALRQRAAELDTVARQVYRRAQHLDVWPGTDYEGSSVDGACLAGRELGWWDAWTWATGSGEAQAAQIFRAVAFKGPVMGASYWRRGMRADADGFMSYSGDRLGGHAYLWSRVRVPVKNIRTEAQARFAERAPNGALWTPNSWGGAGQGWLTFEDVVAAMEDGGDAAMVVTRKRPR